MPAEIRNIVIDQGATFRMEFEWREDDPDNPGQPGDLIPLDGATLHMQIRKKQGDPVLVSASTGDGLSVVDGAVHVLLPPTKTSLLTYRSCKYDIEAHFAPDDVQRMVQGGATIDPNITQEPGDPIVQR